MSCLCRRVQFLCFFNIHIHKTHMHPSTQNVFICQKCFFFLRNVAINKKSRFQYRTSHQRPSASSAIHTSSTPGILRSRGSFIPWICKTWNYLHPEVFPSRYGVKKISQQCSQKLAMHKQLIWCCRCPWVTMTTYHQVACLLVWLLLFIEKKIGYEVKCL